MTQGAGMTQGIFNCGREFLQSYKGACFWRENLKLEIKLQITSDAAGSSAFDIYFHIHWYV